MVAHTGFLVFGRPVIIDEARANRALLRETGLLSEIEPDELPVNGEESAQAEELVEAELAGVEAADTDAADAETAGAGEGGEDIA